MPRYKLPIKPKIIVDTREKVPFDFESDEDFSGVEFRKLDSGDYSLEGMEDIVVVERKRDVNELYNNLGRKSESERLIRELERMPKYRFIVLEASWEDIYNPKMYYVNNLPSRDKRRPKSPYQPRSVIMRYFIDFMIEHNVHIIPAGSRAQTVTKAILLHMYKMHRRGEFGTENQQEDELET